MPPDAEGGRAAEGSPRMVELGWGENLQKSLDAIREILPSALISVRVPLGEDSPATVLSLIESGVSVIHLEGRADGRTVDDASKFIKDGVRSVHLDLVDKGLRDEVTLVASGGIAMAEHVAKCVICGADAVYVDFPLLIALECRMCRRCRKGLSCPVQIERTEPDWVVRRTVNLLGAWHNQLLEVMGAMGIRDARRLRGESGRAMFFEDLDRTTFESMGVLQEGCELE
jgi:glutamate synthase domain-containing protein 2